MIKGAYKSRQIKPFIIHDNFILSLPFLSNINFYYLNSAISKILYSFKNKKSIDTKRMTAEDNLATEFTN
jgi:hypothetical protein